jgi:hypothetical protein
MADADDKLAPTPKPLGGVSFAEYVDMSPSERESFHKQHFRGAARFERAMLDREGHGLATVLVIAGLAGGAFLLWRAAKADGRSLYTGSPFGFFTQGPALAGVVGGGVGAAAGLLFGNSPAKFAMIGAGIGVVGSALTPSHRRGHHHHRDGKNGKAPATPSATTPQAPAAQATRGYFTGAPTAEEIFHAQMKLAQLGYNVPVDGKLTPALTEALKKFQATYSLLTMDGSINRETLLYLDQVVHQLLTAPDPQTGLHDNQPSYQTMSKMPSWA